MGTELSATPGAKMVYLIKRRAETSRDELVAHWFKSHMPRVIARNARQAKQGQLHATRYIATLFDPDEDGECVWDGMAQLWYERALPMPDVPHGTKPMDTFQEKAEPYLPWATTEYVVIDGRLPSLPNQLGEPYPTTRSGFAKLTFLIGVRGKVDHADLFRHWLEVHVPIVRGVLEEMGGIRYVVSHSQRPEAEPYVGMAELYFPDLETCRAFTSRRIADDGFSRYRGDAGISIDTLVLPAHTQLIGIPG